MSLLTPAERRVLHHILRGDLDKEIAASLGVKVSTVKTHTKHLRIKLGAKRRPNLVARAYELGEA